MSFAEEKGQEMLLLTAKREAREAGWSVLTHHQHKHTEEERKKGDERQKRGEGRGII